VIKNNKIEFDKNIKEKKDPSQNKTPKKKSYTKLTFP
jgi:hypothetical protein